MKIKASAKQIKMSPSKLRLVADLVRGLKVDKALEVLMFNQKLAAKPITKLLKSAIANAEHNYNLKQDNLKIAEIRVDEGISMKRWMPRAHGRATTIRKRSSHVSLSLEQIIAVTEKIEARKEKIEEPIKLDKLASEAKTQSAEAKGGKRAKAEGVKAKTGKGFASKTFNRKAGSK